MIEAIIFDFDGLLADTEGIAFEIYQKLLKKHKLSLTINIYVKEKAMYILAIFYLFYK